MKNLIKIYRNKMVVNNTYKLFCQNVNSPFPIKIFDNEEKYQIFLKEIENLDSENTKNFYYKILALTQDTESENDEKKDQFESYKNIEQEKIRSNFHSFAFYLHPDRCLEDQKELSEKIFPKINEAYKTLSNIEKREKYDLEQLSDKEFFSFRIGGVRVSLFWIVGLTGAVAIYYSCYEKIDYILKGGNKCPVDHKSKRKIKSTLGEESHHLEERNIKDTK